MAHEFSESFNQPNDCGLNGACSLGDFAMVRQSTQLAQLDRQSNNSLEDAGILPMIELKYPVGKNIATKEMKDAGVSARESVDDDGRKTTTVEPKSGIKVSVSEGKDITTPSGTKIHIDDTVLIEPNGKIHEKLEKGKHSGVWVDDKGREVVKQNKDGSVTIDTGDGGFVKQDRQGVKKIAAIRSRDGKTFEELDTDSPLGNLRPGDMTSHGKR